MAFRLAETFDWHGSTVRWARFGDGPAVVLCHGTPWSSYVWRTTIAALADRFTVYAWDMLGYGVSDKPDADVSLRTQAALLVALTAHWGLARPHIVAHDFGGAVALRAHLLHDMPVRSLMLVDIVAIAPWGSPFFRLVQEHPEVFAALPHNLHRALVTEYMRGASSGAVDADVLEALVAPWLDDGQAAFYRQIAQADEQFTEEFGPYLPTIAVPTHIVWGRDDQWIPASVALELNRRIPGSDVTIVDNAGHLVQEDQSATLNRIVSSWLGDGRDDPD